MNEKVSKDVPGNHVGNRLTPPAAAFCRSLVQRAAPVLRKALEEHVKCLQQRSGDQCVENPCWERSRGIGS